MRHGSSPQQSTFLLIATNSIHYYWPTENESSPSSLQQVSCDDGCHEPLTLDHLSSCDGIICHDFRARLAHDVMELLCASYNGEKWARQHHHLPISQLLHKLFPTPPSNTGCSVRWQRHLTYAMCGAFSTSEASSAIKTLAFRDKQEGQAIMQQLRLLCVDQIAAFYHSRKQQQQQH
jgi:hypothetical protein